MEKENVIKVKKFPIFWTFLKRNGVTTIHQVRFKALVTTAKTANFGPQVPREVEIVFSVFEIAGTSGEWLGGESSMGGNYHDLSDIYSAKEAAILASQGNGTEDEFGRLCAKDGWYKIKRHNILYNSEWLWENTIPSNMVIASPRKCEETLCAYSWNGIKTIKTAVAYDYSQGFEVCGHTIKRLGSYPLFNMVTKQYLGQPSKQYYGTRAECDAEHQIEVFEFDD